MKRVTAMIPAIEATTARLLDAVGAEPEFDLVAALAFPLPANVVFSLMGVPEQDYAQVKQWCGYRAALSFGRPAAQDQVKMATTMAAYRGYMRDEAAFARPDEFDLHRPDAERHLAFGQGLHYWLGANLGKLEAQIAVAELARRWPRLRLAPDQRLTFHPNISFRGPQVLRLRAS